jgi:hypothetical protein
MVADTEALRAICDSFVRSHDFNGVSPRHLLTAFDVVWLELQDQLSRLLIAGQISLAFASHSGNPHIKRLADLPLDVQLVRLSKEDINGICIYPNADIIAAHTELHEYDDRPYTRRLALAEPQV